LSGYIRDLLSSGPPDSSDDARIPATAAKIAVQRSLDLRVIGTRIGLQECRRSENHARNTVAALHCAFVDERLLDSVQLSVLRQALDSNDPLSSGRLNRQPATRHGLVIHKHRAGTALTFATSVFGASKTEILAQDLEQGAVGLGFDIVPFTVDSETY
jgi:hypothetical protein